jgi:hypothetical protein
VLITLQQSGLALGVATLGTLYITLAPHGVPLDFGTIEYVQMGSLSGHPASGSPGCGHGGCDVCSPAGGAPPLTCTADGGMLGGMAGRKTSVSFDDEILEILARRAEEAGIDRSAYLAQLVRRDDLRRRIAADSATLNAAGYTPDRATALTAGLIARRRSAN